MKTKTENKYYSAQREDIADFVEKDIKTILDIGCGKGNFLNYIKNKTKAETWGVELVPEIAEIAKFNTDFVLIGKIEDHIQQLPNSYFDCITFNDVLEHINDPENLLKILKQKLTPKGIIIASIPNVRFLRNLFELLIKKDWEYKEAGILDTTHLRFFTRKSMRRTFENAGYFILHQKGINKLTGIKWFIFNVITLGFFNDTRYLQYICVVKPQSDTNI